MQPIPAGTGTDGMRETLMTAYNEPLRMPSSSDHISVHSPTSTIEKNAETSRMELRPKYNPDDDE